MGTPTNTAPPVALDRLVLYLFEARRDAKNALKMWQEKAAEIGRCSGCDEEDGPCYLQRNPDLCDVCAAKQPFWEARQKASIRAAVALRRVLTAGKFLSENASNDLFCLFAGGCYYPMGGVFDFRGFGTVDELKSLYAEKNTEWDYNPWGHICEHATMTIVLEADHRSDGIYWHND